MVNQRESADYSNHLLGASIKILGLPTTVKRPVAQFVELKCNVKKHTRRLLIALL
jgi:hypothetical protein